MGLIPDDVVEEIRQSSDIYNLVSEYLRLKKQGRNYVGLCPFHNEKTPSFTVSPDKQIYYCFGCGAGGNAISFVMNIENLTFPEAVKFLADKAGIQVPEDQNPIEGEKLQERMRAYKLNSLVKDFYSYILNNHSIALEAKQYLTRRGIDSKTGEKFQLGFAPPGWDSLLNFLQKKGYSCDYLESQGVALKRAQGDGHYDRFRNRLMFPIWDHKNNVIGFGGRVLDDGLPKYLNSPETTVFNKSSNLYGINFAIPAIREMGYVVIVEGYLDVITCHQYGITNVVASLGTALTKEQGKILSRYAPKIYIAYDADSAGVSATLRGIEILQDTGCRVKVVTIPDGKDPDELIRKRGPESFLDLINGNSKSLIEYKLEKAMAKFDSTAIEGKIGIVSELIPSIVKINSDIEKEEQVRLISKQLEISTQAIWGEIRKYLQDKRKKVGKWDKNAVKRDNTIDNAEGKSMPVLPAPNFTRSARAKAEENLLLLLINHPELFSRVKEEIGVNFTDKPEHLIIINYLDKVLSEGQNFEAGVLLSSIDNQEINKKLSALLITPEPPGGPETLVGEYLRVIQENNQKNRRDHLLRQLEEAEQANDVELRNKLLKEFTELI